MPLAEDGDEQVPVALVEKVERELALGLLSGGELREQRPRLVVGATSAARPVRLVARARTAAPRCASMPPTGCRPNRCSRSCANAGGHVLKPT